MGGVLSVVSEKCKKFSRALNGKEEEVRSLEDGTCSTRMTDFAYIPPKKHQTHQNILTSENFKDYLSSTTKCVSRHSRPSNESEQIISHLKNKISSNTTKFPQSRNIHNISKGLASPNYQNINTYMNMTNYNTYPFPDSKNRNKKSLITEQKQKSKLEEFMILKLLGRGTFGKVLLVRHKKDQKLYAMKVLKKYRLFKTNQVYHTKTEREILEKINHPFIVKLHFAFQTEEKLYLVTEFMQGGELFFHLKREKIFNEEKVKAYVCEIVLAIEHLHKNKIIYRDLKPENILLDVYGHIKLADFGLSKFFTMNNLNNSLGNVSPSNNMNNSGIEGDNCSTYSDKAFTLCGTPEYLAPEILIGKGYDKSVDWWSLGVLIHEMLVGSSPFKHKRERLDLSYYTPVLITKKISENAKDLILNLLKDKPEDRLRDSRDIKTHPFFCNIDWDKVLDKKSEPQFVPKIYLKGEDDLCLFDKNFTMASFSDDENKNNGDINFKNNNKFNKNKVRKIRDDFENFSFTREDVEIKL